MTSRIQILEATDTSTGEGIFESMGVAKSKMSASAKILATRKTEHTLGHHLSQI